MQIVPRKNKINLKDYSFKRDIENRLLLAQLSAFEVRVFQDIIHNSLKISIPELAETLEVKKDLLMPALTKLKPSKLFKIDHETLVVDKEMRKYYESQIEKFDEDFEPNIAFLQDILSKVPINVLPLWYAVPRSSDNIVASIIEKYLITPETYRLHLEELQFDEPILHKIIQDIYEAPNFKVPSSKLLTKYKLTREKFEEYILLLEYHFVCCIRYENIKDQWHEIVSPFQEWLDYINFEVNTKPEPIKNPKSVNITVDSKQFAFIFDMQTILKAAKKNPIPTKDVKTLLDRPKKYLDHLIFKLIQLELISEAPYKITKKGTAWLLKSPAEQSAQLATDPLNILTSIPDSSPLYTPRNFRLIEKNLVKRLPPNDWVYVDDFLKGFISPIADTDSVVLKNKGKKWRYVLPEYTKEEKQFIRDAIIERCFELGLIITGTHLGKDCIILSPFGRVALQ
ncbi:MAG: hypothetical protein H0W88_07200 [Parachlamydiaceae bacterium]|nr:hypothetical protein [Parachlamydiaceae bacterium]